MNQSTTYRTQQRPLTCSNSNSEVVMNPPPQVTFDSMFTDSKFLEGRHNRDPGSTERLERGKAYRDLSTVCVCPTRGMIHAKVVQSWMGLMTAMNQKFTRLFVIGMEVGAAYNSAIENILAHPELSKWKYVLTLEEDNLPPPDGLLKLYESMDKFDVVGGLYWTKGDTGQPMIYGDPAEMPKNFIPQIPKPEQLQQANGLGMGFNLFKLSIFKDKKLPKPWFRTVQDYQFGVGATAITQDLYFYQQAGALGYKFASDNRVRVGHYDAAADLVW